MTDDIEGPKLVEVDCSAIDLRLMAWVAEHGVHSLGDGPSPSGRIKKEETS